MLPCIQTMQVDGILVDDEAMLEEEEDEELPSPPPPGSKGGPHGTSSQEGPEDLEAEQAGHDRY